MPEADQEQEQEQKIEIPPEPPKGPDSTGIRLFLPDGGRKNRFFLKDCPLKVCLVFVFVFKFVQFVLFL